MKKVCMAILPLFAMALSAFAQDGVGLKGSKAKTETTSITIVGEFNWDVVNRDAALTIVRGSMDGDPNGSAEATHHFHARIGVDVDLSEKVKIKLNLETARFNPGGSSGSIANNADVVGNSPPDVDFRECNITFSEVFDPAVTISAGLHTVAWGRFFNPSNSASILNNILGPENNQTFNGLPVGLDGARAQLLPAGVIGTFTRESIHINLALLPVIISDTGSATDNDEGAYALNVAYDIAGLGTGSNANVTIILHDTPETGAGMYSFGGGVNLVDLGVPHLNVSADVMINSGTAYENNGNEFDAKGMGFDVNVLYTFEHDLQPWVKLTFTSLSGDDFAVGDSDIDSFLSYEDIRDLMIIEDPFYGLDIDSNLTAIKISGGASFSIGQGKNNLIVKAIIGLCTAQEEFGVSPNDEDAYGTEIDITARYMFSKQVNIHAGFAMLTGSDVLDLFGGGSTPPVAQHADDSTMLATVGVDAGF